MCGGSGGGDAGGWCADGPWWEAESIIAPLLAAAGTPPMPGQAAGHEELKSSANAQFAAGCYDEAIQGYSQALNALGDADVLVKLLCNLAMAIARIDRDPADAVAYATCALVLRPTLTNVERSSTRPST